jgi:hypothetical protein
MKSKSQILLRKITLLTCSYNVLFKFLGPMELRAVHRLINQGVYETYGA